MTWRICAAKFWPRWRRTSRSNAPPVRERSASNTPRSAKLIATSGPPIDRSKRDCRSSDEALIVATGPDHGDRELTAEERELEQAVERAHRRSEHWQRTGEWPMGRALAMMGRFGWTIVAPILIGV